MTKLVKSSVSLSTDKFYGLFTLIKTRKYSAMWKCSHWSETRPGAGHQNPLFLIVTAEFPILISVQFPRSVEIPLCWRAKLWFHWSDRSNFSEDFFPRFKVIKSINLAMRHMDDGTRVGTWMNLNMTLLWELLKFFPSCFFPVLTSINGWFIRPCIHNKRRLGKTQISFHWDLLGTKFPLH